jgi:hypothetical protein
MLSALCAVGGSFSDPLQQYPLFHANLLATLLPFYSYKNENGQGVASILEMRPLLEFLRCQFQSSTLETPVVHAQQL